MSRNGAEALQGVSLTEQEPPKKGDRVVKVGAALMLGGGGMLAGGVLPAIGLPLAVGAAVEVAREARRIARERAYVAPEIQAVLGAYDPRLVGPSFQAEPWHRYFGVGMKRLAGDVLGKKEWQNAGMTIDPTLARELEADANAYELVEIAEAMARGTVPPEDFMRIIKLIQSGRAGNGKDLPLQALAQTVFFLEARSNRLVEDIEDERAGLTDLRDERVEAWKRVQAERASGYTENPERKRLRDVQYDIDEVERIFNADEASLTAGEQAYRIKYLGAANQELGKKRGKVEGLRAELAKTLALVDRFNGTYYVEAANRINTDPKGPVQAATRIEFYVANFEAMYTTAYNAGDMVGVEQSIDLLLNNLESEQGGLNALLASAEDTYARLRSENWEQIQELQGVPAQTKLTPAQEKQIAQNVSAEFDRARDLSIELQKHIEALAAGSTHPDYPTALAWITQKKNDLSTILGGAEFKKLEAQYDADRKVTNKAGVTTTLSDSEVISKRPDLAPFVQLRNQVQELEVALVTLPNDASAAVSVIERMQSQAREYVAAHQTEYQTEVEKFRATQAASSTGKSETDIANAIGGDYLVAFTNMQQMRELRDQNMLRVHAARNNQPPGARSDFVINGYLNYRRVMPVRVMAQKEATEMSLVGQNRRVGMDPEALRLRDDLLADRAGVRQDEKKGPVDLARARAEKRADIRGRIDNLSTQAERDLNARTWSYEELAAQLAGWERELTAFGATVAAGQEALKKVYGPDYAARMKRASADMTRAAAEKARMHKVIEQAVANGHITPEQQEALEERIRREAQERVRRGGLLMAEEDERLVDFALGLAGDMGMGLSREEARTLAQKSHRKRRPLFTFVSAMFAQPKPAAARAG